MYTLMKKKMSDTIYNKKKSNKKKLLKQENDYT